MEQGIVLVVSVTAVEWLASPPQYVYNNCNCTQTDPNITKALCSSFIQLLSFFISSLFFSFPSLHLHSSPLISIVFCLLSFHVSILSFSFIFCHHLILLLLFPFLFSDLLFFTLPPVVSILLFFFSFFLFLLSPLIFFTPLSLFSFPFSSLHSFTSHLSSPFFGFLSSPSTTFCFRYLTSSPLLPHCLMSSCKLQLLFKCLPLGLWRAVFLQTHITCDSFSQINLVDLLAAVRSTNRQVQYNTQINTLMNSSNASATKVLVYKETPESVQILTSLPTSW